jgi:NADPH2:quinone reductase
MKAIQIKEYVKVPAQLKTCVVTVPDPVPKPDEYLIAVRAAAANFFDILQVQGKYQHQPPFPVGSRLVCCHFAPLDDLSAVFF